MAVSVVKTWGGQKELNLSTRAFGSYCHVIQDLVPRIAPSFFYSSAGYFVSFVEESEPKQLLLTRTQGSEG